MSFSLSLGSRPRFTDAPSYLRKHLRVFSEDDAQRTSGSERPLFSTMSIIQRNKRTSEFTPERKSYRMKMQSLHHQLNMEVAKLAKRNIYVLNKKRQQFKLKEKFRRSNMCLNRKEVYRIKHSWGVVTALFGLAWTSRNLIENRKRLHDRSENSLKWLCQFSRCAGKVVLIAKALREKRALDVLNRKFHPYIHKWILVRKEKYQGCIMWTIKNSILSDIFLKLMERWRAKFIVIQRFMKKAIFQRKIAYAELLSQWNLCEIAISTEINKKRVKQTSRLSVSKRNPDPATVNGTTSIPNDVKLIFIRDCIRNLLKEYHSKMIDYTEKVKHLKSLSVIDLFNIGLLNSKNKPILPLRPSIPVIKFIVSKEEYQNMISRATRERPQWDHLRALLDYKVMRSKGTSIRRKRSNIRKHNFTI